MKKAKYHKHCRHHEHVKKVKAMINRALTKYESIGARFWFELTGVCYEDHGHLKYMVREAAKQMTTPLFLEYKQNMEDLTCDFNFETHRLRFEWANELNNIMHYIGYSYPENFKTAEFIFSNPDATGEEKMSEYKRNFELNPVLGFNKSFYATYKDGRTRQLWSITSTPNDLIDAVKLVITYE
jgi:hypothetical protein